MVRAAIGILGTAASLALVWSTMLATAGCARERTANTPATSGVAEDDQCEQWEQPPSADGVPAGPELGSPSLQSRSYGPALAIQRGQASYYGDSLAGHRTANGERYDPRAFTAAHKTLAFGTIVRVVRPDTGAWVNVRITDRGPFVSRRILDLSRAAAERLHMIRSGVVEVRAEVVRYGAPSRKRRK